jgi:hypothetical protein
VNNHWHSSDPPGSARPCRGVLLHFIFLWELPAWDPPPADGRYAHGEKPAWFPRFRVTQIMETTLSEATYKFIPSPDLVRRCILTPC